MSARVRGLVLSGDASQIVVEPTGGEVARFGRGQAVAVVALDARPQPAGPFGVWEMTGVEMIVGGPFPFASSGIAAELRTLCGCSKLVVLRRQVSGRPPETIQVPIMVPVLAGGGPWVSGFSAPTTTRTRTRTFRRQQQAHDDDRIVYVEQQSS